MAVYNDVMMKRLIVILFLVFVVMTGFGQKIALLKYHGGGDY